VSYLAVDLDALNVMPDVAAAAGITPGAVAHGLLKLWAWCFREEVEVVSEVHLKGFFGVDAGPALEAFGFLSRDEGAWRVRGAQRYLRVKQAQREGGRKGRALSSSQVGRTHPPTSTPTSRSTSAPTSAPTSGSEQALTPSTEHRTPNTVEETTALSTCVDRAPIGFALSAKPPKAPAAKLEEDLTDEGFAVWEHWRVTARHPRARLDKARRKVIVERLKDYSVAELQLAIDGCAKSAWHQGENDRGRRYDDLTLILRDAEHVERFLEAARG
jgi:hypothetical protein